MIERYQSGPKLFHHLVNGQPVYSHIVVSGRKRMVFIAGQLSRDEDGEVVGRGDMRAQMRQCGENLKAALAVVGATLEDLVQTCTYVTSLEALAGAVDVRHEYLGVALPTSTTVEVKSLAGPDFMIEVNGIAMID